MPFLPAKYGSVVTRGRFIPSNSRKGHTGGPQFTHRILERMAAMPHHNSTEALEVAVYTVQDPEGFAPLQRTAHQNLAAMDGFVHGLALRGLNDPALRADVIHWTSAELAQKAADGLPVDARFETFIAAIQEMRHFTHYAPAGVEALVEIGQAPVIEIAAFTVTEVQSMQALQRKLHQVLPQIHGVVGDLAGQDLNSEFGTLDLIGWTHREAFQAAPKAMVAACPELAAFFEGADTLLMKLFEVER